MYVGVPFVVPAIGMGFELEEGLVLGPAEEPDGRPGEEVPFTVAAVADGLLAGALLDMGRTSGALSGGRDCRWACEDRFARNGGRQDGRVRRKKSGRC